MSMTNILQIVYIVLAFLVGAVPAVIGFVQASKNKRLAKTKEEKALAEADMKAKANEFIETAETFYKALDTTLKSTTGETAGPYKKESVMAKLQTYATEKSYAFDYATWSDYVDKTVKLTKAVNSK